MWVACRRRARILLAAVALVGVVAVVPALAGVSEVDRSTSASGPGDKSKPTGSGDKSQPSGSSTKSKPSGSGDKSKPAGSGGKSKPGGSSSTSTSTAPKYGLHQDLTYDGYAWRRAQEIDAAASVHAQISRNSFLWSRIEPTPGTYDWSIPDSVVDGLRARGIETLFVVVGSPSWINGGPPGTADSQYYVPTDPQAFANWVKAYTGFIKEAVKHFKGRVSKWEIWNEENEHFTWKPQPSISQYAQFFVAMRGAIKSVDPAAEVAIGGLTDFCCDLDIPGSTFVKGLIAQGVQFENVAIHPYPTAGHPPDVHWQWHANFDDIAAYHDLLVGARRNVPIWVTEWGWSSARVGDDLQAEYLARSLDMLRTMYPYVTVATYFVAVDSEPEYFEGLFHGDLSPKPAAAAFTNFI